MQHFKEKQGAEKVLTFSAIPLFNKLCLPQFNAESCT